MNDKGYQANIPEDRFLELSTNPQTGVFNEKSIFEPERYLQGEVKSLYSNLRRTNNPKVDLDFEATNVQIVKPDIRLSAGGNSRYSGNGPSS